MSARPSALTAPGTPAEAPAPGPAASPSGSGPRGWLRGLLVGLGFAALLVAWVMATPPFGEPDEAAHYLRALSISNGVLLGPKVNTGPSTNLQHVWNSHDTRSVLTPPRLSPPGFACINGKLNTVPPGCPESTYTGDYQPLAYLLPAAVLKSGGSAESADWLARAASAVPVLGLLILAAYLLAPLGPWALAGLLLAVTPMVLFVGSSFNPSGLDCAAALAFTAGAIRVAFRPELATRRTWWVLGVTGVVTILAWQAGPAFVVLGLVLAGVIARPEEVRALRRWGRAPLYLGLVLGAAVVIAAVYGLISGSAHGGIVLRPIRAGITGTIDQLFNGALPGAIGNFGLLTVRLPTPSLWIWWVAALLLVGAALWVGTRRDRIAVGWAIVCAFGFPAAFFFFFYRQSGFGLQARYVLPVLMLLPLAAGIVLQRRCRDAGRRLVGVLVVGVAAFQLFAWWFNARHSAGRHAVWFLSHPLWSPPGGWWPWTVLAVFGAASLASVSLTLRPRVDSP